MNDLSRSPVARRLAAALQQPTILAVAAAAAVTLLLAAAVLTAWSAGPDDAGGSRAGADSSAIAAPAGGPTPTPRVIATRVPATAVPSPAAAAPTAGPTAKASAAPVASTTRNDSGAPRASAPPPDGAAREEAPQIAAGGRAPDALAPITADRTTPSEATATPRPRPTPRPTPPTPEPLYEAEGADLVALAAGSWTGTAGQLRNESASPYAEKWLVIPAQPDGEAYALEAEVRVSKANVSFCNENFGLVVGSAAGAPLAGGGVIFACKPETEGGGEGGPTRARLSDLAAWPNGYFRTQELAGEDFDPDDAWHTYRLEVRNAELRLLVDGEELLAARAASAASAGPSQLGIWTEGVVLAVRRVAVLPLGA